jgi:hypothetical protein
VSDAYLREKFRAHLATYPGHKHMLREGFDTTPTYQWWFEMFVAGAKAAADRIGDLVAETMAEVSTPAGPTPPPLPATFMGRPVVAAPDPSGPTGITFGPQTELQQFKAMLGRAGVGHGTRHDYNPPGEAVQVECDDSDDSRQWTVCEFVFGEDGKLQTAICYEGQ